MPYNITFKVLHPSVLINDPASVLLLLEAGGSDRPGLEGSTVADFTGCMQTWVISCCSSFLPNERPLMKQKLVEAL